MCYASHAEETTEAQFRSVPLTQIVIEGEPSRPSRITACVTS
jgi:hypothetical protein